MNGAPVDLKLPRLTSDQPPQFTGLASCKEWLAGVPITNATQTQAQLLRQLNLLNHYALPHAERLKILEFLRTPINFVHEESTKRFSGRARPPAPPEQAAFDSSQALWQALETGYLHCLQDEYGKAAAGNEAARNNAAFAASRALTTLLIGLLDHCAAGVLPAAAYWQRVHRIYLVAEQLQIAQLAVDDKLRHMPGVTVAATYVEILLLAAAQPLELTSRELAQVSYWAHRWSAKVPVLAAPPEDLRTPPLCLDLAGEEAASFQPPTMAVAGTRWLDLTELRKTIKQRLVKLAAGESPKDLKLGKDCVQPACELLLRQVYEDWCKGGRAAAGGRPAPRSHESFQLAGGIEPIHYFISGRIFRQPEQSVYLSQREHDEIATFGRIATRFEEDKKLQHSYVLEEWQVIEESVGDLRLRRALGQTSQGQTNGRLIADQLVAVRANGNQHFQLGKIRWAFVAGTREFLVAGVQLLPGAPGAVALYTPGTGTAKGQYCRGFCLPAVEALAEPASLLAPGGWFRADARVEIHAEDVRKVRVTRLIERGADFDRCAYEVL